VRAALVPRARPVAAAPGAAAPAPVRVFPDAAARRLDAAFDELFGAAENDRP
jgi:hypothetical protein